MIKLLGISVIAFSITLQFHPSDPQWNMASAVAGIVVAAVAIGLLAGPAGVGMITAVAIGMACGGAVAYLVATIYDVGQSGSSSEGTPTPAHSSSVLIAFDPATGNGPQHNRITISDRKGDVNQNATSMQAVHFDELISNLRGLLSERRKSGLTEVVVSATPYPGLDFIQKIQQICTDLGLKFTQEEYLKSIDRKTATD